MNYPLICRFLGLLCGLFTLAILVTLPFALYYREWNALFAILESVGVGMFISLLFFLVGRKAEGEIYRREALAIVGLSWIIAAAIGALPYSFSHIIPDYSGAYFESMSGLTTTGASVLGTIEDQAKSIILWRSLTNFIGGLGIIVLFVAVLPMMGVGGRALFKQEVPGPVPEGLTPRIRDTAVQLFRIYIGLNCAQLLLLMIAGMSFYDALNHSMTTIATGGFSTRTSSVLAFASPAIEWIVIIFMFVSGANFTLHLEATRGRFNYFKNAEFRAYFMIVCGSALFITFVLWIIGATSPAVSNPDGINLRDAFFTVVSVITTTGFGTVDFNLWPDSARILLLILMFFGGCAGSTSGGMKIIRWLILYKTARQEITANAAPRQVHVIKMDGRAINKEVAREVLIFFFVWISFAIYACLIMGILMPGLDLITVVSAVASMLNNVGPGLELVGPTANYSILSGPAKWLCSLLMVLGRLELYAILVLFSRGFWRTR